MMRPEDVPTDLVVKAVAGWLDVDLKGADPVAAVFAIQQYEGQMRTALAAVLPDVRASGYEAGYSAGLHDQAAQQTERASLARVSTDRIREAACRTGRPVEPEQFDAWLAAHDRVIQAQAWDEGFTRAIGARPDEFDGNPYRAARLTATTEEPA